METALLRACRRGAPTLRGLWRFGGHVATGAAGWIPEDEVEESPAC